MREDFVATLLNVTFYALLVDIILLKMASGKDIFFPCYLILVLIDSVCYAYLVWRNRQVADDTGEIEMA